MDSQHSESFRKEGRRRLTKATFTAASAFVSVTLLGGCQLLSTKETQIGSPIPASTPAIVATVGNRPDQTMEGSFAPGVEGPIVITEAHANRTLIYNLTTRFGIDLDPSIHDFEELDYSSCGFIGYVSNWSINGPDSYPIGFEVTGEGSCVIRNGSFQVIVEGKQGP